MERRIGLEEGVQDTGAACAMLDSQAGSALLDGVGVRCGVWGGEGRSAGDG